MDQDISGKTLQLMVHGSSVMNDGRKSFLKKCNVPCKEVTVKDGIWTLLFHALLHSSHCLLMDKIAGTQADLQKGSHVVKLGGSLVDVQRILHPGDVVVFDLGHTYFRSPVQSVRKAQEFQVSKPFPYDKTLADIYICKSEWQALERLSWRRNDYFAHSQSCEMSSSDLNTLIQDVAQVYLQFQVPAHIIAQMKAIGKGIYYSFEHNLITICMRYNTMFVQCKYQLHKV